MNEAFREQIRIGMAKYNREGVTCRPMTDEELRDIDTEPAPKAEYKGGIQSFEERRKQVLRVIELMQSEWITVTVACERVGISHSNYKSVRAAMKRGVSKR